MKKPVILFGIMTLIATTGFSQVKALKATSQKLFAGIGGGSTTYIITLKNKVDVDSVKSKADGSMLQHYINQNKGGYEISFGQSWGSPAKCRTCPDATSQSVNLTKGVIVYYKNGGKKGRLKVKKFQALPDIMAP